MRHWRSLVLLVIGLAVLAATGCRDSKRESLMTRHQAFAAKLRSQTSGLSEMRELAIPDSRKGETLLALAPTDDLTLLAVATTHRLLCLSIDNGREAWTQWQLPRAIESVAALHVDSASGMAHVVIWDDGRVLSGDCRKSGSALGETASVTKNQPAVAWVDAKERAVWIAPMKPAGPEVVITARPLPGADDDSVTIRAAFPGEANPLFPNPAVIHSMAKVDDNILLFYGDANPFHNSDLRDESVLVISIDDPERSANKLVFAAAAEEGKGGQTRWISTQVRRVLPASAPGRIYVVTEAPPGVVVLGSDAKPIEVQNDSLFAADYRQRGDVYDLSVKSSGKEVTMDIRVRETGSRSSYALPWRFKGPAEFAAISGEGRRVVVASPAGDILFIDLGV